MKTRALAAIVIVVAGMSMVLSGCGPKPVVKKVDHIVIQSSDARGLFEVFTEVMGLPQAWAFSSYPDFETGGVQAGNVNIETLHYGPPGDTGTALYGIVLEPYPLSEISDELNARGAKPSKPEAQTKEVEGKEVTLWTNVYLESLSFKDYLVYLCEYEEVARSSMGSRAAGAPSGGIGLESVREVVIESSDPGLLMKKWEEVFAPWSFSREGTMAIGTGPLVRIIDGDQDAITGIVLEVASLEKAGEFLEQNQLLGESSVDSLCVAPEKVQGLDIRIVGK